MRIELAVATKLKGGINTSLLALTPTRNKASLKATVPLETTIAYLEPVNSANKFSNLDTHSRTTYPT